MNQLENHNCEAAVLVVMFDKKKYQQIGVSQLKLSCFTNPSHIKIFQAFKKATTENLNIDEVMLSDLSSVSMEEIEAFRGYNVSVPENFNTRVKALLDLDKKRKLINYIKTDLFNSLSNNFNDLANNLNAEITKLHQDKQSEISKPICDNADYWTDILFQNIEQSAHKPMPIERFKLLNSILNGIQKGRLYVLAGESGLGKTALAINIAVNLAKNYNVYFNCLEMPSVSLLERAIADECNLDSYTIQKRRINPEHKENIRKTIKSLRITFEDSNDTNIDNLLLSLQSMHSVDPFDAIFLDYLNLFNDKSKKHDSNAYEIAEITQKLKVFAVENNIAVVLLAQFNASKKSDIRAEATALKGSTSIRQDADVILLIDKEKPDPRPTEDMLLIIEKNRAGKRADIRMTYEGNHLRFIEKVNQYAN